MKSTLRIPKGWSASDIPDLSGKRFVITGATSGIGLEAARELVRAGGEVIIAARNPIKAERTVLALGRERSSRVECDVSSLDSVRSAARKINGEFDVLILNAGIMAIPFTSNEDGFEMQMATNHLGHFALAALLKDQITSRVVTVSSSAHRMGDFGSGSLDEISSRIIAEEIKDSYSPWKVYGTSKLANMLFGFELERRARANDLQFTSMVVHPGYADTNLQYVAADLTGDQNRKKAISWMNRLMAQDASMGALPTLAAAAIEDLHGGALVGPDGFLEMRGHPRLSRARSLAYDQQLASNLWQVSEELTGVTW
jgi:NAD(P)-dependent dehydrogenase (short-subunit alcohol dehydrogenase family)